jgi:hypothetical protein
MKLKETTVIQTQRTKQSGGSAAEVLGIVIPPGHSPKNSDHGFALYQRGNAVKIQGISVLPTRKPRPLSRFPGLSLSRFAARRN